ncbi:hypothetical protein CKAH01_06055 [Colletotrichum kahawae]|uniref:Uncharacterized protein n=1 Tax=Colletotrichum kahawae TaxID=34407 RepID=A0AAE0D4A6_COLKA|nr:hypothetical protein CKAH01_06055 [Colletotrichum kahawae]
MKTQNTTPGHHELPPRGGESFAAPVMTTRGRTGRGGTAATTLGWGRQAFSDHGDQAPASSQGGTDAADQTQPEHAISTYCICQVRATQVTATVSGSGVEHHQQATRNAPLHVRIRVARTARRDLKRIIHADWERRSNKLSRCEATTQESGAPHARR